MLLLTLTLCAAQGATSVVLVTQRGSPHHWPQLEELATAEMRALGLTVETRRGRAQDKEARRVELVRAANELGAVVALRLARHTELVSIELWVTDDATGKMRFREIPFTELPEKMPPARYISLAVIEMLEGALIEVGIDTHAAPKPPVLPRVKPPPEPPSQPTKQQPQPNDDPSIPWSVSASAVTSHAVGGLPFSAGFGLSASAGIATHLNLVLDLRGTFMGEPLQRAAQRLDHSLATVSANIVYVPWRSWAWRPEIGVGIGGFLAHFDGEATEPFVGRVVSSAGVSVQILAVMRVRVTRDWSLAAGVAGVFLSPKVDVNFVQERVASFGPWLLQASVGVSWCFLPDC